MTSFLATPNLVSVLKSIWGLGQKYNLSFSVQPTQVTLSLDSTLFLILFLLGSSSSTQEAYGPPPLFSPALSGGLGALLSARPKDSALNL